MKIAENQQQKNQHSFSEDWEEKQFSINSKLYYYNGPINKETQPLLQILSDMEINSKQKSNSKIQKLYTQYQDLEQKYFIQKSFMQGNWKFDLNEIIKIIVYWSAFFSVLAESINISKDQNVMNDETRLLIAEYLPLFAFLYTFLTQIFQQIRQTTFWILLFIFLVLIPSLVMIGYHFNLFSDSFKFSGDYIGLGLCITSIAIFINSVINKILFIFISGLANKLIGTLFNCGLCILVSYFILFKIIAITLIYWSIDQVINQISNIIAAPIFISVFFISIFLIQRLFVIKPKQIQNELDTIINQQLPSKELSQQFQMKDLSEKISKLFNYAKLNYISPSLISILYITLELYFFINFVIELKATEINISLIICYAFLMIALPLYISFGICISNYKNNIVKTYFYIPLIFGVILSLITIKLWNETTNNDYLKGISRLIGISPLIISLIWLTVAFFRYQMQAQKMFTILITCFCFAFPLGVLLTLSDALNDENIKIGVIILVSLGCIPILILLFYYIFINLLYIVKLPAQSERLNFQIFQFINIQNYALWLNSIFFIITFFSISYFAINEPASATGTKKGTMIGLLIIHILLFIQTNAALSLQVYESYEPNYEAFMNQIKNFENISLFGIVAPLMILLPASLALYSQNKISETTEIALLSTSVGVPLSFSYFLFQISTKIKSVSYQNFLLPLFTIIIWIFFIGPIGVIFPIFADIYENSSDEFAVFSQLAVAYTLLIFILYVTISSIFYSVLLNKEYLEMKKREVLKIVMQIFTEGRVKCYEDICALIFLRYIQQNDPKSLKSNLINGDPVNIIEYVENETEQQFDFLLVSKNNFDAQRKLKKQEEQKRRQSLQKQQNDKNDNNEIVLEHRSKTISLDESFFLALQDFFQKYIFCNYGASDLNIYEQYIKKQKRKEQLTKNVQQKNDQILSIQPNQIQQGRDFFIALKEKKPDRPERFWQAVYVVFKKDFSSVLDYLQLEQDNQLLQEQYKSFRVIGENNFTISIEDFALFLYDHYSRKDLTNYREILWEQALKNYQKFNLNHYKLLSEQFIKKDSKTAFHTFKPPKKSNIERPKLKPFVRKIENQNKESQNILSEQNFLDQNEIQIQPIQLSRFRLNLLKCCRFSHQLFWVKPVMLTKQFIGQITDSFYPKIQQSTDQVINKNMHWGQLAERVSDTLVSECVKFDIKMLEKENVFKITATNISALIFKIYDMYGLATLAFNSQVGWFGQDQTFDPINTVDYSAIWNEYTFFFVLALTMSVAYFILGIKASSQISKNTYGFDDNLQVATWKSFNFWLSKSIQFISGQFIFVMKTYIDAVICDYTNYPYTLVRKSNIECMSDYHFIYVVFAIVGCGIYYPLSTYLQPTFQFMDHSLDLKYKSSYVVILNQAKLLILGLSSVFSNFEDKAYTYQMLFSSLVMLLLIIFNYKLKPCYVKWFNIIELGMLAFLFLFYFGAFLVMVTSKQLAGFLFVGILGVPVLIVTIYFYMKKIQEPKQNSKNQVHPQDSSQDFQQTSMLLGGKC